MRFFLMVILVFFCCDPDCLQEAISGCEIDEGTTACFDLENNCKKGFSRWEDPEAANQTKCQCCDDEKE